MPGYLVKLHYKNTLYNSVEAAAKTWLSDTEVAADPGWKASAMASSDTFHVFAGPPLSPMTLSTMGVTEEYTVPLASIAVFQGFSYGEARAENRLIGTGTSASVVVGKYAGGTASIQRGVFLGKNFARLAYAWLTMQPDGSFSEEFALADPQNPNTWPVNNPDGAPTEPIAWADEGAQKIVGLGQKIFDMRFGLLLLRWSVSHDLIEAIYMENVGISGYSRGITPGATFEVEGLNLSFTRIVAAREMVLAATTAA